ncbi:MAG: 2Fe-2S iron-sulfur cluster-binding protein [Aureliella sp.]
MPLLPYAFGLIALGMLCLSSAQFASVGLRTTRSNLRARGIRLRRQWRLGRESQHARLASELTWQTATDAQNRWRVVEVVEIVDESADCRSFYLRDPLGAELPDFQPGQFIMVRPALGGADLPARCYSLSDAPGEPWWRITVKRQPTRSTGIDGRERSLSAWLHERIGVGDCLLISPPCGEFVLDDASARPIVLLAAGIGITPLASMLKYSLQSHPSRPVHLFFQVQDDEHWPLGEVLHSWQQACPALSVTTYFSRELPLERPAHGGIAYGKFDAASIVNCTVQHGAEGTAQCKPADYYLCGPEAWMDALVDGLTALAVPREQIHLETFATASDSSSDAAEPASVEPWSLSFDRSELHLEKSTQATTIWQAASDNGLQLPAGCHSGACGSCRVRLLRGQVQYRTRPQCSLSEREVLACIAQPRGDVVVDA